MNHWRLTCILQDTSLCVALGYGKNEFGDNGYYSSALQRTANMPIAKWTGTECEKALNGNFFNEKNVTWTRHPSFLCAGGDPNMDTCEGDGGGPLVCLQAARPPSDFDSDYNEGEEDLDLREESLGLRQAGIGERIIITK